MTSAELWKRRYNAVFKLMQKFADAGRIMIDQYECETTEEEKKRKIPWYTILNRMDLDALDCAVQLLVAATKEVDSRYGDPDPEGNSLKDD